VNLRDLTYALAVAEHGHFSRAAEACGVSQPTLSGQIRKLEDELGVELFERDGRTVRVTAAGKTILEPARRAVGAADDMRRAAEASRDPLKGPLRVGMIPTLAPYLLPHLLPAARERLAAMPLRVVEEQTEVLERRLAAGEIDVALLATMPERDGLVDVALFDEPLLLAMPAQHPLARKRTVDAKDVDGAGMLLLAGGNCLREQTLALCTRAQAALASGSDLRATNLETLLNLVEAGYGVTVLPGLALEASRLLGGALVARPFTDNGVVRRVRLVHRRFAPRSRAFEALAAAIAAGLPRRARAWLVRER
jgi:LysR family hydrogen peroxide-inducible transcriptional activator